MQWNDVPNYFYKLIVKVAIIIEPFKLFAIKLNSKQVPTTKMLRPRTFFHKDIYVNRNIINV